MAILIEANYSKKLGLPGFSSHSYSVTLRSELSNLSQVERESAKLYALLQTSVDREIQEAGFVPTLESPRPPQSSSSNGVHKPQEDKWACSPKQKDLILKIISEHHIEKQEIEAIAQECFNSPVKALNKAQASGLIDELIEKYGPKKTTQRWA